MQSVGSALCKDHPVYDIPHLEEFVKAIDEYRTKKGGDWEETVHELSGAGTDRPFATKVVLYKETYGSSRATLRFGKDIQGTPEQKANSFTRTCDRSGTPQSIPTRAMHGLIPSCLTRADGSTYRFLAFHLPWLNFTPLSSRPEGGFSFCAKYAESLR